MILVPTLPRFLHPLERLLRSTLQEGHVIETWHSANIHLNILAQVLRCTKYWPTAQQDTHQQEPTPSNKPNWTSTSRSAACSSASG